MVCQLHIIFVRTAWSKCSMRNFYSMEVIQVNEMRACCVCGTLHLIAELIEFDDSYICRSCLHTETVRCQRCGERIWTDANAGDDDTPLCQRCYDRYYTTCEDCGRVLLQDDCYYESDDMSVTMIPTKWMTNRLELILMICINR